MPKGVSQTKVISTSEKIISVPRLKVIQYRVHTPWHWAALVVFIVAVPLYKTTS